ncbi:LytTR family DNA-binding domain-containing protein [Blautia coccoides]|uniref:LytR/AlgR family response regulator transcription factor n=1 Tax=Blautia producta TaxID=33035 RepID=UPI0028A43C4C|nr:LytTR family DNA-binding domain-containing protein [Blautia coccoides]MDT4377037.1 LytTR family DNA-binding domain-containing protein [Blautia coccoides]
MITIAVCDDSKKMVINMENSLKDYAADTGRELRVFTFYNGEELLSNYHCKYDILFLDIKMPGINGIEVAEKIREKDQKVIIIFLTSLVQHALDGYKVNAANYLIKPITKSRLKMELNRWIGKLEQSEDPYITVHNDSGDYKILLKSISYIETYNRNLMIHTDQGNIVCYWKMKEMENKIRQYGFARNHSSFIVNLFYVSNIEKMDIKLMTGERIPIGKSKKKDFMSSLALYWGGEI